MSEIYTLVGGQYRRDVVVDNYVSSIWTERFIDPGEIELVLPATVENYALIVPGTLLGHSEARQPMLIDSVQTKDKQITATGKTLLDFFNQRHIDEFSITASPGFILATIVEQMQEKATEEGIQIPNLLTGVMAEGDDVTEEIEGGPAGDALLKIAKKYGVGMGVYRVRSDTEGYELHFSSRVGDDLFSTVRFAPGLDNFTNVEDLISEAEYKTVAITRPPTGLSVTPPPVTVYNESGDDEVSIFRTRVLDVDCTDITDDDIGRGTESEKLDKLHDLMEKRARDELDDVNRVALVDGEVTPAAQYKYYEAYNPDGLPTYRIGDQVSAVGNYGQVRRSYITEYIRSQNKTGTRSYPTLAANPGPKGKPDRPPNKRTKTFIIGPASAPIQEGTVTPPYFSHAGRVIGFRHVFHGGGSGTVNVYAGDADELIASVDVDDTRNLTKLSPSRKMKVGDPIYIEVVDTVGSPSGLSFSVIYG